MGKKVKKASRPVPKASSGGKLIRTIRKTILFNEKEMAAIKRYCTKYKIASSSAFIRTAVMSHIMSDIEENYPKLF